MGPFVRTIGIAWAKTKIGMANLVYNMRRLAWLTWVAPEQVSLPRRMLQRGAAMFGPQVLLIRPPSMRIFAPVT